MAKWIVRETQHLLIAIGRRSNPRSRRVFANLRLIYIFLLVLSRAAFRSCSRFPLVFSLSELLSGRVWEAQLRFCVSACLTLKMCISIFFQIQFDSILVYEITVFF